MVKLQSPPKHSPFDAIHLMRHFFHCSKQHWNLSILTPFSVSAIFCFTFSTSFPFKDVFIREIKKKLFKMTSGEYGEWGTGAIPLFCQKLLNTHHGVGRCAHKSPIMKWANTLSCQKFSLKPNASSHNNTSWYTDTDRLLEQSLSRGRLYYKGSAL